MNLFNINTTAFMEEDFLLLTDLTEEQIVKVLKPIVYDERDGGEEYDNEMLVEALIEEYPNNKIIMHQLDNIDNIVI
jgi:hypothetical protein